MQNPNDRRHDIEVILLIAAAHASSHFYHLVIPSLFPWIMPHFGLNNLQAGALMTVFFVVSAAGQSLSGFLVDKTSPRIGLYAGLALLGSSALVLSLAQNYPMIMLAAAMAGLGNSVFHPADYSLLNYNVSQQRLGHAFAWHNIVGNVGWAICPLFMVTSAEAFGWRTAAVLASSVAFLVLAAVFVRRKVFAYDQTNVQVEKTPNQKEPSTFGFLLEPAVWFCFFFFFFTSGAFGVLQSFSQTIFGKAYGLDLVAASSALTAYMIGAGTGAFCGAFLAGNKWLSSDRVVGLSLLFSALMASVLASQWLTGLWAVPLMAAMGFGVGLAAPSRDIMIRAATVKRLGMKSFGRVYGFTYCGMDVGQSLSPIVFGPLLDAGLFTMALGGVALLQTLAVFTALQVGKESRKA